MEQLHCMSPGDLEQFAKGIAKPVLLPKQFVSASLALAPASVQRAIAGALQPNLGRMSSITARHVQERLSASLSDAWCQKLLTDATVSLMERLPVEISGAIEEVQRKRRPPEVSRETAEGSRKTLTSSASEQQSPKLSSKRMKTDAERDTEKDVDAAHHEPALDAAKQGECRRLGQQMQAGDRSSNVIETAAALIRSSSSPCATLQAIFRDFNVSEEVALKCWMAAVDETLGIRTASAILRADLAPRIASLQKVATRPLGTVVQLLAKQHPRPTILELLLPLLLGQLPRDHPCHLGAPQAQVICKIVKDGKSLNSDDIIELLSAFVRGEAALCSQSCCFNENSALVLQACLSTKPPLSEDLGCSLVEMLLRHAQAMCQSLKFSGVVLLLANGCVGSSPDEAEQVTDTAMSCVRLRSSSQRWPNSAKRVCEQRH